MPKKRPTQYQQFWTKINAVKFAIPDWQQQEDSDGRDNSDSTTTTITTIPSPIQTTIMQQSNQPSSITTTEEMKEPDKLPATAQQTPQLKVSSESTVDPNLTFDRKDQPKDSSKPTVNPDQIIDGDESIPYEKFVKVFQRYFLNSNDPNSTDHAALKHFNKILRDCKLLLKNRRKFQVSQANFLPFNYNEKPAGA